jgi:hypothetical protein
MIGQSHDYKRNGTTTLFAALNVAAGAVTGQHHKRRRREEFLAFMNRVVAQHAGKEIHVILDNLSTHKPKRDMWLNGASFDQVRGRGDAARAAPRLRRSPVRELAAPYRQLHCQLQ